DMFIIDSKTAKIRLKYDVDDTTPTIITFQISAFDVNASPRTSYATVEINVSGRDAYTSELQRAKQTYTVLFAIMTALLTIFIILTVFACYKWRVARSYAADRNESSGSALRYESAKPLRDATTSSGEPYEHPDGEGYSPLERTDFTGQEGTPNPAYTSASSFQTPKQPAYHEPSVDYPYQRTLNTEHISLQNLNDIDEPSQSQPPQ
ncbi:uncharacterized protein LOC121392041, partial [Gigantopelta aegis]|uniref:uncharacterized protein LOC121392041 n=1 Tax=Gigantopelta aegis TaxID=1735272 RepID=UPI001B88B35D